MALVDVTNLNLGPCQVVWDNIDLGYHRGATLQYNEVYEEIKAEDHGEILYDRILKEKSCQVTVTFNEVVIDLLEEVLINSTTLSSPTRLRIGTDPNVTQRSLARLLRLHPINSVGFADDVYLFKALPYPPHLWTYNNDDRTVMVLFKALQHSSFSPGLFQIGGINQWS